MPNWKTHLEVGKRFNKKFNFKDEDYNLFLLGNILPDINNCYIVKDISTKISHSKTHFNNPDKPGYLMFYDKYQKYIEKSPLFLGCYIHLFTDYTWNNNFYTRIKGTKFEDIDRDELRKIKQSDFRKYNNNFINNTIELKDIDRVVDEINLIDEISLTKEDITKVLEYLKNQQKDETLDYKFYISKELDDLLNKTMF